MPATAPNILKKAANNPPKSDQVVRVHSPTTNSKPKFYYTHLGTGKKVTFIADVNRKVTIKFLGNKTPFDTTTIALDGSVATEKKKVKEIITDVDHVYHFRIDNSSTNHSIRTERNNKTPSTISRCSEFIILIEENSVTTRIFFDKENGPDKPKVHNARQLSTSKILEYYLNEWEQEESTPHTIEKKANLKTPLKDPYPSSKFSGYNMYKLETVHDNDSETRSEENQDSLNLGESGGTDYVEIYVEADEPMEDKQGNP